MVYAVEFSHRSGRDLTNMAKRRPNVVPIVEDARQPQRYRPLEKMSWDILGLHQLGDVLPVEIFHDAVS